MGDKTKGCLKSANQQELEGVDQQIPWELEGHSHSLKLVENIRKKVKELGGGESERQIN